MTRPELRIYTTKQILAESLAADFIEKVSSIIKSKQRAFIALSGGSTPSLFFKAMVKIKPQIDWSRVHFFWVDERCVPPNHPESNFGVAFNEFFKPLHIPESSYSRIKGENDPQEEAKQYSKLIMEKLPQRMNIPVFDLIFLGMGSDGHTASVFPHQIDLWNAETLCTVGVRKESGQSRVTFTGKIINAAENVIFLVTGIEKAEIVYKVISRTGDYEDYPASLVNPSQGDLEWYLDETAGYKLK